MTSKGLNGIVVGDSRISTVGIGVGLNYRGKDLIQINFFIISKNLLWFLNLKYINFFKYKNNL